MTIFLYLPLSLCSKCLLVLSVQQLQEKLKKLERGSVEWIAEANKCEESLMSNVHFCLYKEEIGEVSIAIGLNQSLISYNIY